MTSLAAAVLKWRNQTAVYRPLYKWGHITQLFISLGSQPPEHLEYIYIYIGSTINTVYTPLDRHFLMGTCLQTKPKMFQLHVPSLQVGFLLPLWYSFSFYSIYILLT